MYITILKTGWPIFERFLAKRIAEYIAEYLQKRREQRLQIREVPETTETSLPEEPVPALATGTAECPPVGLSSGDAFWYTMSGIFLGSALAVILTYLIKPEK